MQTIEYIDSHTAGEPTRTVIRGAPKLGEGGMDRRRTILEAEHDWLRTSLIHEPRGSDWLVGALLQKPVNPQSVAGIIFFNNVGYLGMCGHGLIGVVKTLAHLEQIEPGAHRFETPAGDVAAVLHDDHRVSITNVISYRFQAEVELDVPGEGVFRGDIAYGGNWFFLASTSAQISLSRQGDLTRQAKAIRRALSEQGICGRDGEIIDHIELFGPPSDPRLADSRNFVLCPGGEYDRSPCGTGTSAKLACLAASGRLAPAATWRQESITGSVFTASYAAADGGIAPTVTGRAFIMSESKCVLDDQDPFRHGIHPTASQPD
jgi:4-hydroxyproline epimerase